MLRKSMAAWCYNRFFIVSYVHSITLQHSHFLSAFSENLWRSAGCARDVFVCDDRDSKHNKHTPLSVRMQHTRYYTYYDYRTPYIDEIKAGNTVISFTFRPLAQWSQYAEDSLSSDQRGFARTPIILLFTSKSTYAYKLFFFSDREVEMDHDR